MFSDNIRQNQEHGWQCNDKTPTCSHITITIDQSPYAAQPNENSLTLNDNVQIVNENDRSIVSLTQSLHS